MRIAILSMQRVVNYGSFLQAYSLKKILESWGHTVTFIDIKDENGSINYLNYIDENEFEYQIKRIVRRVLRPSSYCVAFEREHLFRKKLFPMLGLRDNYNSSDNDYYDLCIIGSDEVFNCCQTDTPWGHTLHLFGKGVQADRIITYAASFGNTTIDKLKNEHLETAVAGQLQCIDNICVRDDNSRQIVKILTGIQPDIEVDPVFLSDYSNMLPKRIKDKNYLIVYGYDGRICDPDIVESVKIFARNKGLKTIGLGMAQTWCDDNIVVDPFTLLMYFKNASYIVTDTFHGTVFSIKYQKQFASIIRKSNEQKLTDLLNTFCLESRGLNGNHVISEILEMPYNVENVRRIIDRKRETGLAYLQYYTIDNA